MTSPTADSSSPSSSSVEEAVRREVPDWDDEVASMARFKAFSGQRSDWEGRLLFWRDIILKVARRLGVFAVRSSEFRKGTKFGPHHRREVRAALQEVYIENVKNVWFSRGGLTPLCMDCVLHEMHANGDILLRGDLIDPTSGHLYQILRRVKHMIGFSRSSALDDDSENLLILKPLLQERADDVIKILNQSHWTSTCIVTITKFQSLCKGPDEASIILSYLSQCGKARYLAIRKDDFIEGVKFSPVAASVRGISTLDYDVLQLTWTTEKLQRQLDVIDHRWEISRKLALASFKSGNKQAAYRCIRQSKLFSERRIKCTALLERVEEVLGLIGNAESTKKVSEAIQVGARAIKEHSISIEEVHFHIQELDELVDSQKQLDAILEPMLVQSVDIEDDMEEEFQKLEAELKDEIVEVKVHGQSEHGTEGEPQESAILSQKISSLNLEAA